MNNIINSSGDQKMLSDLVHNWFDYIETRFAPMTITMYKLALKQFLHSLPAQIRSFFRWAANYYQIDNPATRVSELIEESPKYRCLSQDEYQKIVDVAQDVESAALQFLGNTGLRRNEFRSLTYANFTPDFIQIIKGKGHKKRLVPLNNICKQLLQKYSQNDNSKPLFVEKFQPREALYDFCQRLARQVSIPSFGPHALRHFFATRLIRAGVPLIKVSQILGHSSIITTERIYVHLVPRDLLGVTDCLEI